MRNKKELLFVFAFVVVLALIFFVIAATVIDSPTTGTNHSGTINLSVTTDFTSALNVTFYYNESGGAATVLLTEIINTTSGQTVFENDSFDISGLNDSSTYNISVTTVNETGTDQVSSVAAITIDNTAPNATVDFPATFGNYSGTINLNATVVDALLIIDTVFFNITNSTGGQNETVTLSNPSGNLWNATLNTSNFIDGTYNITVYGNDSVNNLNSSEVVYNLTFDNTVPSSIILTASITTKTSLTLTVSIVDATSGIGSVCTTTRGSVSGTTTSQTLTESSLTCNTNYTYTVTCTDLAGNSNSSAASTFETSACSTTSTGSGPSSSGTQTWTSTYVASSEQLLEGYTKELSVKHRVKVVINNTNHYVGVLELTTTTAKIQVSSDPVEATLNIGEDSKFDVTNNSFYDIFVKLNDIANSKANITVRQINEAVPEGEPSSVITDPSGEVRDATDDTGPEIVPEEKSSVWLWVIVVVLALLIILGIVFKDKIKEAMHS